MSRRFEGNKVIYTTPGVDPGYFSTTPGEISTTGFACTLNNTQNIVTIQQVSADFIVTGATVVVLSTSGTGGSGVTTAPQVTIQFGTVILVGPITLATGAYATLNNNPRVFTGTSAATNIRVNSGNTNSIIVKCTVAPLATGGAVATYLVAVAVEGFYI